MLLTLIIIVVATALIFDYTNDFHDAANAIATSVATRALTPRVALLMAAVFNMIGALLGHGVAQTIGSVITEKVVVPMVLSPLVGFALAYLTMIGLMWVFRRSSPGPLTRKFRTAQIGSAAAISLVTSAPALDSCSSSLKIKTANAEWEESDLRCNEVGA